jgi:hypothetical protein
MKRIHFSLSIGYPTAKHEDVFEFEDDITDAELDEAYQEWCQNYLDGGWRIAKDSE